jgi:hypothetical protein
MTTTKHDAWLQSLLLASVAAWTALLMAPIDPGHEAARAPTGSAPDIAQLPYVSAAELQPALIGAPSAPPEELPPTF